MVANGNFFENFSYIPKSEDSKRVVIPEGVTEIDPEAFAGAEMKELVLPLSLRRIGDAAFMDCALLERVWFAQEEKQDRNKCAADGEDSALSRRNEQADDEDSALSRRNEQAGGEGNILGGRNEQVHRPNLVKIGSGAFANCGNLHEFKLPDGLIKIEEMAFFGTGLTEVTIPASVKEIGEMAFWDCPSLTRAEVTGRETVIGKDAFGSCPKLLSGYFAPGFPPSGTPSEMLLTTIFWCGEAERFDGESRARAEEYFLDHEELVMERLIEAGQEAGIRGLLGGSKRVRDSVRFHAEKYMEHCMKTGNRRLMQLFLAGGRQENAAAEDEFEL